MSKKNIAISAIVFFAIVAAGLGIKYLNSTNIEYSYIPMEKNISEMASVSSSIVLAAATGQVEELPVDDHLSFILTEAKVIKVIEGDMSEGQTFKILGTKGVPIDIRPQTGNYYIIFCQPYVPGVKEAQGCFVLTQAFKGIYRIDSEGNIYQYNIEGQEELSGDRINEVKTRFEKMLPELTTAVSK